MHLAAKTKLSILIIATSITCMIFAGVFIQALNSASGADDPAEIEFKINGGMGVKEIGQELYDKGLIKSKFYFTAYSLISGKTFMFKPGIYKLKKNRPIGEIIGILTKGPKAISATITPGMTLREIDDYLFKLNILNKGALISFELDNLREKYYFLKNVENLEGFLFPDTYMFFSGSSPDVVIFKILDNFQTKAMKEFEALHYLSGYDILDKLSLASILEKEVIEYKDKQIVAGILEKRLKIKMPLQVDASVIYAKCSGKFVGCAIGREDFKIDSPHNTYKYQGYPLTPISNPGLESIKAALDPVKTDYLYYLSDLKTKKTIFAKAFDEHNYNRTVYLR